MPQSHPTTGPVRLLSPVRFLARKGRVKRPKEFYVSAVLVVISGYGPRTTWHGCILIVWLNNSQDSTGTTYGHRTGLTGLNLQCFSYPVGPVRGPCVTRKGAVRRPYWHVRELTQLHNLQNSRTGVLFGHTGPIQAPYGPHTGCSRAVYDL